MPRTFLRWRAGRWKTRNHFSNLVAPACESASIICRKNRLAASLTRKCIGQMHATRLVWETNRARSASDKGGERNDCPPPPESRQDAENRIAEFRFLLKRREVETDGEENEEDVVSVEVVKDLMASYEYLLYEHDRI